MIRYRHEYKYMLDARQRAILQIRARAITQIDPHAGPDGTYVVRSVYFDDMNDSSLLENLSGTDPRKIPYTLLQQRHRTHSAGKEEQNEVLLSEGERDTDPHGMPGIPIRRHSRYTAG